MHRGGFDQAALLAGEALAEGFDGGRHQPLHELAAMVLGRLRLVEQQALLRQLPVLKGQGHRQGRRR